MSKHALQHYRCDGGHGSRVYSVAPPVIARALDGWGTVNSELDCTFETGVEHDLCPACMVELWSSRTIQALFGLPSCGYEMEHQHDEDYGPPRALFVWVTRGDITSGAIEWVMVANETAWCDR